MATTELCKNIGCRRAAGVTGECIECDPDQEVQAEHDLHHVDIGDRKLFCNCGRAFPGLKELADHCGLGDLYNERLGH